MGEDAAVGAALIDWINCFSIPAKVTSLREFSDGVLLRKVLREIDFEYFGTILPESGSAPPAFWLPKFQSLKETSKALKTYIRDVCGQMLPERASDIANLKAIAEKASEADTILLLKLVLFAAIYSPKSNEYIIKIQNLSLSSQESIKAVIEAMQSEISPSPSTPDEHSKPGKQPGVEAGVDPGLLYEEHLGNFVAENDTLKRDKEALQNEVTELTNRLGRLQENNQILQERLGEAEGKAKGSLGDEGGVMVRDLQVRIREQDDLIADQEAKLTQHHTENKSLQKTIEGLQSRVESVQRLEDELDEVKVERDNLAKKANTLDKFKQKLKETQNLENENRELRKALEEIKSEQRTGDDARQELSGVKMMIQQYRTTVEKVEQDNHELQTLKRHLEIENSALVQKLSGNMERQARDTELIQDLQDKVRDLEAGALPGKVASIEDDLDTELVYSDQTKTDLKLEIALLKAEVESLKGSRGDVAKAVMLEGLLEDARSSRDRYQKLYLDDHQANLVLESQLSAVQEGNLTEGSLLFLKLRAALAEATENLSGARKTLSEAKRELKTTRRDLDTAKSDLSLVGEDERDVLAKLKDRNSAEVVELRAENDELHAKVESIQVDLEQHRSLLNVALVEKDAIQKSLIDRNDKYHELERAHQDFKTTLDILNASSEGREEGHRESLDEHIARLQAKVENHREKGTKRQEHIKKQKASIKELQERLQRAEESDKETMAKAKEILLTEQKVRWEGKNCQHSTKLQE
ncbi:MAG: hypothetical protein M1839_009255 [Geoglossum umbratile]|nr:MAG: hypothetical protein M1839_009255 [Geoglossum umbratile]